jgi:hypothetical protein
VSAHATQRLPFPRYSVGLLQSETEMVQAPEHDLLPFLELDGNWDVDLYTEATVEALVKSANRFDCIVVGHNAAHKSADVRAALARLTPNVGLLVLHQLDPKAFSFMVSAPVEAEELKPAARGARLVREADRRDEILLNWPDDVALAGDLLDPSLAYVAVTPTGESSWETVLEMTAGARNVPVLLRSMPDEGRAAAISTVLLAPRHPPHRALLRNLLMWCSAGRPDAVIIETPDPPDSAIVHRKLRLQGVKAVVEPVATTAELDFGRWPLWGTRDALLPEAWDPTQREGWPSPDPHRAMPWLRRGHRIILLGPGESLTIRHGESDSHWVARRWATWFKGVETDVWHGGGGAEAPRGSIVATRAVLRVLAAVYGSTPDATLPGLATAQQVLAELEQAGRGIDPVALGLPPPSEFTRPVAELLRRRIGGDDNIDETVSATVTAVDIDALLGGQALGEHVRARLEGWLRREVRTAALEDRLDIARCLGDEALAQEIVAGAAEDSRVDQPVSAVLVTALRSAIVACRQPPELALGNFSLDPDRAVVDRELRMRPMLAAGYLIGVLDLQRFWAEPPPDEPARTLRDPPPDRVDRAVITLGRHGPLSRGLTGATGSLPELASTEALALIAYFARHPVPTHVVSTHESITPGTLTSLLKEAEKGRRENERLRRELTRREAVSRSAGTRLAIAGLVMIVPAVILFVVALAPHVSGTWQFPSAFVFVTLLVLGLLALLSHYELPVPFAKRVAPWLAGGWGALTGDLAKAVVGKDEGQSDTRG